MEVKRRRIAALPAAVHRVTHGAVAAGSDSRCVWPGGSHRVVAALGACPPSPTFGVASTDAHL